MKRTILSFAIVAILAAQNDARAVLGVGDIVNLIAEEALIQKNIFDKLLQGRWSKPSGRISWQRCTTH